MAAKSGSPRLLIGDREVRAGRWPQLELAQRGGGELAGRRVGIIGMGQIGRECATRYAALGCDVAVLELDVESPPGEHRGVGDPDPLDLLKVVQALAVDEGMERADADERVFHGKLTGHAARGRFAPTRCPGMR